MLKQNHLLMQLKQLRAPCCYPAIGSCGSFELYAMYFADAARPCEYGQIGDIGGLVIGDLKQSSVYHAVDWNSHLSKRPTKSSGSAETLAAGEAVEMGIICRNTF